MPLGRRTLGVSACIILLLVLAFLNLSAHPRSPAHHDAISVLSQATKDEYAPAEVGLQQAPHSFWSESQPQPETPKCRVTKVSMLYGEHKYQQLKEALASHSRHSERWGCGFEHLEYDLIDRKLYSKHYFLLSTMLHELSKPVEQRRQWLMWVDADSIILNPAISPEIFLPPEHLQDVYALLTADQNGLNAGVFYLRVHYASVDLLTQIVAYPLAHSEEDLGWFGEQAAMANVIKSLTTKADSTASYPRIAWLPRTWFNTYQFESGFEGQPGYMLVHFAGLAETRLSHMADWLDELQLRQVKWEVPLVDTFYPKAISEFWAEFEANSSSHIRINKET